MVCIYCANSTRVVNSRHQKRSNNIWRRRLCDVCGATFTTQEKPDLSTGFMVHKKNTSKIVAFSKEKLFLSIHACCLHREDPIADALGLTDTVIVALPFPTNQSIGSLDIAKTAHTILDRFDGVAAALYKAYHLKRSPATS